MSPEKFYSMQIVIIGTNVLYSYKTSIFTCKELHMLKVGISYSKYQYMFFAVVKQAARALLVQQGGSEHKIHTFLFFIKLIINLETEKKNLHQFFACMCYNPGCFTLMTQFRHMYDFQLHQFFLTITNRCWKMANSLHNTLTNTIIFVETVIIGVLFTAMFNQLPKHV